MVRWRVCDLFKRCEALSVRPRSLSLVAPLVERRLSGVGGGTNEKFIGDAVVAVFGAPAAQEEHAKQAPESGGKPCLAGSGGGGNCAHLDFRCERGIDSMLVASLRKVAMSFGCLATAACPTLLRRIG